MTKNNMVSFHRHKGFNVNMDIRLSRYVGDRDNNFNLLRFIAAMLVLYSHSYALAIGTPDAEPLRSTIGMTWGTIAVDIFFITSGFLITSSFLNRVNVLDFIVARFLRIYPALIVAMFFSVFIVGIVFTSKSFIDYFSDIQTAKYFLKNITLIFGVEYFLPGVFTDVPSRGAVNGSLWTLPYEIRMYTYLAIIGSVIFYFQKDRSVKFIKIIFLTIGVVSVMLNIFNYFYMIIDGKFIRLFSMFFMGSVFYIYREHIFLSSRMFYIGLSIISLSILQKEIFYVTYSILVPYIVLFIAYVPNGKVRLFNRGGDYSYGLYIYAFPVQQIIAVVIPNVSVAVMILSSFLFTMVLAYFSWHIIEKRFLGMKKNYIQLLNGNK